MQAGAKPAEAHKRTLEFESPAEALGPADKKRIVESSTAGAAAAAVGVKAEPASASHGQQNGSGAHPASSAAAEGDAAAGQVMKQEQSITGKAPVADRAALVRGQSAGCAGDVRMTDASDRPGSIADGSAPHVDGKASSAATNGVTVKQEQQDGPVLESAQRSRAATPELKIERLDASTGQVRSFQLCEHLFNSQRPEVWP